MDAIIEVLTKQMQKLIELDNGSLTGGFISINANSKSNPFPIPNPPMSVNGGVCSNPKVCSGSSNSWGCGNGYCPDSYNGYGCGGAF